MLEGCTIHNSSTAFLTWPVPASLLECRSELTTDTSSKSRVHAAGLAGSMQLMGLLLLTHAPGRFDATGEYEMSVGDTSVRLAFRGACAI